MVKRQSHRALVALAISATVAGSGAFVGVSAAAGETPSSPVPKALPPSEPALSGVELSDQAARKRMGLQSDDTFTKMAAKAYTLDDPGFLISRYAGVARQPSRRARACT